MVPKGFCIPFVLYTCSFLIAFYGYFKTTCISCCAFSERLNFVIFKIDKSALKNFNGEEHGQSENEDFEVFFQRSNQTSGLYWKIFCYGFFDEK